MGPLIQEIAIRMNATIKAVLPVSETEGACGPYEFTGPREMVVRYWLIISNREPAFAYQIVSVFFSSGKASLTWLLALLIRKHAVLWNTSA